MEQARDALDFSRQVLKESKLPRRRREELTEQLNKVEARMGEPNLYLAVIGEFSSGKSTFINALLRDDLLPSSATVTTLSPIEIRSGPSVLLELKVRKGAEWLEVPPARSLSAADRTELLGSGPEPCDTRDWLRQVTTDPRSSRAVVGVRLTHPAVLLGDGIVIIDTPGVEASDEHDEDVRRVLDEVADLAVIVISAENQISKRLAAYLESTIGPQMLRRCVWIVTKMSRVDNEERSAVLDECRRKIGKLLGVKSPDLFSAQALSVLARAMGKRGEGSEREQDDWIRQFEELEQLLTGRLQKDRSAIVSDRIVSLMADMLEEIEEELGSRRKLIEQAEAILKAGQVSDLATVKKKLQALIASRISSYSAEALARCGSLAARGKADTIAKVSSLIDGAATLGALNKDVTGRANSLVAIQVRNMATELESATNDALLEQVKSLSKEIDRCFTKEYERIADMAGLSHVAFAQLPPLVVQNEGHQGLVLAMAKNAVDRRDNRVAGGAAAGLAAGFVVPVIGHIVGAAVGAVIGWFASPALPQVKRETKEAAQRSIGTTFDELEGSGRKHADELARQATAALEQRIGAFENRHSDAVKKLVNAQRRRASELTRDSERLKQREQEARARRTSLLTSLDVSV
jgi:septin family protein